MCVKKPTKKNINTYELPIKKTKNVNIKQPSINKENTYQKKQKKEYD